MMEIINYNICIFLIIPMDHLTKQTGWTYLLSLRALEKFVRHNLGPTTRVSGAAVSRPLDPLVMRFINKEAL